jgi:translation initiation factor IF-3
MKDFENLKRDGKKEKRKSEKMFKVGEKIEDHDLEVKIKQMIKYLNKGTMIRIKFQTNRTTDTQVPILHCIL